MTKPTGVWRKVYSVGLTRVRQRKKKPGRVVRAVVVTEDPPLDPAAQKLSNEFERLLSRRNQK